MNGLLAAARGQTPTVRLLVANQFGINVGFYMLMPYLASYLSDRLGLTAGVVGLVLGVRNLGQQGMFLIGGTLADRLGCRPMIIAGCLLRTASFALLAAATSVPVLLVASAATGLAGAMFNPAVRAYIAAEAPDRRPEAFAVFNIGYQAGILVGPLIGLALTALDFRLTCAAAAAVFATLTAAQWRALPHRPPPPRETSPGVLSDWRTVLANRGFLLFAVLMTTSYVLSFQVYLALPLSMRAALGDTGAATAAVAALFAVSGALAVFGQTSVQRWCARRHDAGAALTLGVALMAVAFVPPALATAGPPAVRVAAALACAALLSAGSLIAFPYEMHTVVRLAGDRLVATHYGLYQTIAGVGIAAGTALTGQALDTAGAAGLPALPWLGLTAAGLASAAALHRLHRRHRDGGCELGRSAASGSTQSRRVHPVHPVQSGHTAVLTYGASGRHFRLRAGCQLCRELRPTDID